jgi:hypothetical protein
MGHSCQFVLFQVVKCVKRLKWYCSRVVEMHTPERNVDGSADTIHGVFCLFLFMAVCTYALLCSMWMWLMISLVTLQQLL